MARKKSKPRRPKQPTLAQQVDKYDLYLRSVQEPSHEVAFFARIYRKLFGKSPRVLREDFCGTFAICCAWVKRHADRRAIGVDLDPQPLDWGRTHLLPRISDAAQQRIELLQDDVRRVIDTKADIVAAQNFSFWIFKTRPEVKAYFEAARQNIAGRGMVVLDMMGGHESMVENHKDRRRINEPAIIDGSPRRFTYIWEQHRFDPITHDATFFIHFDLPDGSKLKRAFRYDWRFWSIPEVCELLREAGFRDAKVYWEGVDRKTGEGNNVYTPRRHAAADPAWIAYIVGIK